MAKYQIFKNCPNGKNIVKPISGNIKKAKARVNSLPKFIWLMIAVVMDAIPICIKPIIEEAAPAVVVKFSRAIGVSNGTLKDTPTKVKDSIPVRPKESCGPVRYLNV